MEPPSPPLPPAAELPVRIGRVQTLQEHFQVSTPHGALTKSLFDGVRGCCFSMHLQDPSAIGVGGSRSIASAPVTLVHLVFRNFYAAALRLVQVNRDGSFAVLLEDHPLMQHAHCEDDAQNWHVVPLDKVDLSKFECFCVYLFQPSPLWEKWEIQSLKLYCQARGASQTEALASSAALASGKDRGAKSSSTLAGANDTVTQTLTSASSSSSPASSLTRDDRLAKRSSRTALTPCLGSKEVQENAARCLSIAARLRVLLHSSNQQP